MSADGRLDVVLVGKTGTGKSSLGNTLLGREAFRVTRGLCSPSGHTAMEEAQRFGTCIQVLDTPGLCDTHRTEEEILQEVGKSILTVHPGPYVVLLVLRSDARFTLEEYSAYATLKALCGAQICRHMIVVFTGIDHLHDTPVQQRFALDQEVQKFGGSLRHVLDDVDFRYYGVNNKAARSSREQSAGALVEMMETLVTKNQATSLPLTSVADLDDLCTQSTDRRRGDGEDE